MPAEGYESVFFKTWCKSHLDRIQEEKWHCTITKRLHTTCYQTHYLWAWCCTPKIQCFTSTLAQAEPPSLHELDFLLPCQSLAQHDAESPGCRQSWATSRQTGRLLHPSQCLCTCSEHKSHLPQTSVLPPGKGLSTLHWPKKKRKKGKKRALIS